jgi:hypothetical protein
VKWFTLESVFIVLVFLRFFSEYFDRNYGVPLSSLISGMFIVVSVAIVMRGRYWPKRLFLLSASLVLLAMSASVSAGFVSLINQSAGWSQVYKYFTFSFIPLVGYQIARAGYQFRLFSVIFFASVISCSYAIYEGIFSTGMVALVDSSLIRSLGFSSHPVILGMQILFLISWAHLAKERGSYTVSKWFRPLMAIYIAALFFTYSRTAWISVGVFLLVMYILSGGIRSRLYFTAIITVFIVLAFPEIILRFEDLGSLAEFVASEEYASPDAYLYIDSSMHWRLVQWYNLFQVGLEHIYIGVGPSQTEYYNDYNLSSHSSMIEFFVEQGLPGVMAYLAVILSLISCALSVRQSRERNILSATIGVFVISSFFSISLHNQMLNMLMLLLLVGVTLYPSRVVVRK